MSEPHSSPSSIEAKDNISRSTSQEHHPLPTTLPSIMAPLESSLSNPSDASASKDSGTGKPIGTHNTKSQIGNSKIDDFWYSASKVANDLPPKAWDMIWKLVANDNPRNVDIWAWSVGHRIFRDSPHDQTIGDPWQHGSADQWEPFRFMTTQFVPPILHVNVRSRTIALEYYKLSFGVSIPTPVGEYKIEPRIYRHIYNDCICPMGRFDYNSVDCFWEALPEGAPAIALNLCSVPYTGKESEEDGNKLNHDEFGDEDWRGTDGCPQPFHSMMGPYELASRTLKKTPKIYLYNYTDYFCKRGPRDFRFTPFVVNPEHETDYDPAQHLRIESPLEDSDHRTVTLLREASAYLPSSVEYERLCKKWGTWLKYGGLTWLKDGGPKPSGERTNPRAKKYSWQRKRFFETLQPWEEEQFIKRGDPATKADGPRESFSGPGIREVRFMKLEIHG
ncbi:hypothetical protein DSL72_007436 [Monilinia vaccinii-corymbosi]|uniref:2EXR domain-containing protein n=1 Tax=Monilinia vaccinii-corymbosi TaxID=61207 RepID=A0A8A3PMF4_9HELO|nr:hypothetical protein DSL72_007436 [Monilinia vaccinii-corymbosi]